MEYLLVVPVRFFRLPDGRIATESAFKTHLMMLSRLLAPKFDRIRVAAPLMDSAAFEAAKDYLGYLNEDDGIFLTELFPGNLSRLRFWFTAALPTAWKLFRAVRGAGLVHSGLSYDLWFPFEFFSIFCAALLRRKSIFVVDIDNRQSALMNFRTGVWSRKTYAMCKFIYAPLRSLQIRFAVLFSSLLLLKGQELCEDYGKGKPHVKNLLDTAFSEEHIIGVAALDEKMAAVRNPTQPLEITYFGRLTRYKGIDYCIRAVHRVRKAGHKAIRLHIIGAGDDEARLRQLARELGEEAVIFYGALPFGPSFFEKLYSFHLLLAAPLSQDTPRSTFDALAAAIPVLAFDTYYYRDLQVTGAVDVSPWLSEEGLAEKIIYFDDHREALALRMKKAVAFARENTQEIWLNRRIQWTFELFEKNAVSEGL